MLSFHQDYVWEPTSMRGALATCCSHHPNMHHAPDAHRRAVSAYFSCRSRGFRSSSLHAEQLSGAHCCAQSVRGRGMIDRLTFLCDFCVCVCIRRSLIDANSCECCRRLNFTPEFHQNKLFGGAVGDDAFYWRRRRRRHFLRVLNVHNQ